MLTSFRAKSFRCFRDLKIDRLGRVNLIVGKNGVGKTSLLEAIWLYAGGGQLPLIREILGERDEFDQSRDTESDLFEEVRSLFNGRRFVPEAENVIELGPPNDISNKVSIKLAWLESRPASESGEVPWNEIAFDQIGDAEGEVEPALIISIGGEIKRFFGSRLRQGFGTPRLFRSEQDIVRKTPPFLRSHRPNYRDTLQRWDTIVLTESEDRVIECLNILAPIEAIRSVRGNRGRVAEGKFLVQLENSAERQPLKSLGGGVETMLQTAVAIEYSFRAEYSDSRQKMLWEMPDDRLPLETGVIFVDEIESGIHYSALGDYWRFLFNLAEKLDVQIFATTHSWECLEAFQQAATANENSEGMLLRLEKSGDDIKAVTINEEDLAGVTRSRIEVR